MNCREVREVADSFLRDELLTEASHEVLEHLKTCASCRTEIDARRALRRSLQSAFDRAPDLQPRPEFLDQLRADLRGAARGHRSWTFSHRWLAVAAGVVLAAGLTAAVLTKRGTPSPSDVLAQDAVGDHRNCALKFRLVRMPVPLEEAAQRFDRAFQLLISTPPDSVTTSGGVARVVERHSCAYGTRRFGHVVLNYQGHVVSLLVPASGESDPISDTASAAPHLIGRSTNGLSVVSVNGSRHAVLLVSDLGKAELEQLSQVVSLPLAQRLATRLIADRETMASLSILPVLNRQVVVGQAR
jgi:anti-sigma factor RsiW